MSSDETIHDVAILGGGIAGLAAAHHLNKQNISSIIIDANEQLGGLLGSYQIDNFHIERFYHHLQLGDRECVDLIDELQLGAKLQWLPASVAHYAKGRLHPLNSTGDILRFPLLTLWQKARLGLLVKGIHKINDLQELDDVPLHHWIDRQCGKGVYEAFFEPLIRGKFGDDANEISAAWLVARIRFRSGRTGKGEILGYLEGGFHQLIEKLLDVTKRHCALALGQRVERIEKQQHFSIKTSRTTVRCKRLISTLPPAVLLKVLSWPQSSRDRLNRLKFQKVICATLGLKRSLVPHYWCNIGEPTVNFALLIEHSNFHRHPGYPAALIYLANYLKGPTDPLWQMTDDQIINLYSQSLKQHFGFNEEDMLWWRISRAPQSGLVYRCGTLANIPGIEAKHLPGLYTIGMFRSFPERSINDSIKQGQQVASMVAHSFGS